MINTICKVWHIVCILMRQGIQGATYLVIRSVNCQKQACLYAVLFSWFWFVFDQMLQKVTRNLKHHPTNTPTRDAIYHRLTCCPPPPQHREDPRLNAGIISWLGQWQRENIVSWRRGSRKDSSGGWFRSWLGWWGEWLVPGGNWWGLKMGSRRSWD